MATVKFHKVMSLPANLEPDSIYFVKNGTFSETYLTSSTGEAASIGNSSMITSVVNPLIVTAISQLNTTQIVANISARNALSKTINHIVMVKDATADSTVAVGAALYVYETTSNTWTKIAEYESLDVSLNWSGIVGKPNSAPSLIDDAVTKRHAHSNILVLDQLSETSGKLAYKGQAVSDGSGASSWSTNNW